MLCATRKIGIADMCQLLYVSIMLAFTTYLSLFAVSFLAATILPVGSEPVLIAALAAKIGPAWALVAVATLGNTAGATLNWLVGRGIETFKNHRYFPVTAEQLQDAQNYYARFGRWALLLSWVPIVGDAITVAAGTLREKFWPFVLIVGLAKGLRYCVVAAGTKAIFQW